MSAMRAPVFQGKTRPPPLKAQNAAVTIDLDCGCSKRPWPRRYAPFSRDRCAARLSRSSPQTQRPHRHTDVDTDSHEAPPTPAAATAAAAGGGGRGGRGRRGPGNNASSFDLPHPLAHTQPSHCPHPHPPTHPNPSLLHPALSGPALSCPPVLVECYPAALAWAPSCNAHRRRPACLPWL